MAQINTNIAYSINRFKIPSDEIEVDAVFSPITSNLDGWVQWEEDAKAYVEDGLLKFPSIEDDDINYSIIYSGNIQNITKIEFDWKVECEEKDSSLRFGIDNDSIKIDGNKDWETKIIYFKDEVNGTVWLGFGKENSDSSGEGTGYFKNIVITTAKELKVKNGNYIRSKLSRFPTILNQNTFKLSRFPTISSKNNFEVSKFKNHGINYWHQINKYKPMLLDDGVYSNTKLEDDAYGVSGIVREFKNIKKISFEWKVSCGSNANLMISLLPFNYDIDYNDNDEVIELWETMVTYCLKDISGEKDWVSVTIDTDEIESDLSYAENFEKIDGVRVSFAYVKDDSESEKDGTGYIRNIVIDADEENYGETFKNQIKSFENINNKNTFIIKSFTNQTNHLFYRLGRDLTVPPKRIIFKNFED